MRGLLGPPTATGKIFAYGVLVTILVAAVVIYQVLANDIRDHLTEYATLKAMGHTLGAATRVVIEAQSEFVSRSRPISPPWWSGPASTGRPRRWRTSR